MEAYSMDLRERVVRVCDEGGRTRGEIARLFQVSTAWIRRLLQRRRAGGSLAPRPHGGGPKPIFDAARYTQLRQLVSAQPDATLRELRERLGLSCSLTVIHNALRQLRLSYKKDALRGRARARGRPAATPRLAAASAAGRRAALGLPR
jgi:transposase